MISRYLVGCGCMNFRDMDGLAFIGKVGMYCNFLTFCGTESRNATSDFPANAEESNLKVMSMLPSFSSAIKVSDAVISLPSASVITSPVNLIYKLFRSLAYSRPTSKPLYVMTGKLVEIRLTEK